MGGHYDAISSRFGDCYHRQMVIFQGSKQCVGPGNTTMAIAVLLADDEEVIRAGLKRLLIDADIEVTVEVTTGDDLVQAAKSGRFDVALVDVRMPGCDGLTALQRLHVESPGLPVVVFSAFENANYIARALAIGAVGFIAKCEPKERWVETIRAAAQGVSTWTRDELRRVTTTASMSRHGLDCDVALTQREGEVLRLLAAGLTNREIAQQLQISYETVKEHVQHILRKIGVNDRTQAAIWAVRKNLV